MKRECTECGRELLADDIAIFRKLVNRNAAEFLCMDCLAEKLGCTRCDIEKLIDYYRSTGKCTLFV
ncbi:hypothetical protein [Ruminococcus sp.]|uniref:hypothetical protein n=1 Tax=Ruminococcus sp. TaxID=41978 RepID=UPI0025F268EA|nr:hypothetical protein [Ruminococcus sp.]MBQ8966119.1 hypothetical protein [Ruminococcus sp.]